MHRRAAAAPATGECQATTLEQVVTESPERGATRTMLLPAPELRAPVPEAEARSMLEDPVGPAGPADPAAR